MSQSFDVSKSISTLDPDSTLIAVIEMSQTKWLVAAMVPGVARQPLKKIGADPEALFQNLPQLLSLLGDPSDEAGRTDQRRAEQIAQRLRGPILGDESLDIEIDRRPG